MGSSVCNIRGGSNESSNNASRSLESLLVAAARLLVYAALATDGR